MSQRQARALNPDEERFESGNFATYELNLTWDEEEYCLDKAYAKILETFQFFPQINHHAKGKFKVRVPEGIKFFVGRSGPRARDLAWSIQRRRNHFVAWRPVEHSVLPTLKWLTEIQARPAIRIMAQIELKYILPRVEQMIDNGVIWYDEAAHLWLINPDCMKSIKRKKQWDAPRKSRPQHGRPRSQVKSRNLPSGTSTGFGKNSAPVGPRVHRANQCANSVSEAVADAIPLLTRVGVISCNKTSN